MEIGERERLGQLADLAICFRNAQHSDKDGFTRYISGLRRESQ